MSQIFFVLFILFQILILVVSLYFLIISLIGAIKKKEKLASSFLQQTKFAVLIPAHNEEAVIEQIINSLNRQNYNKEMYDIFVIADNCSDKTADIAESLGVNVFRRFNDVEIGKGFALKYAFERINSENSSYDAFTVLDADNLADKDYLLEMNKQFCLGAKVIQGNIEGKNSYETWLSASYAVAFFTMNRVYQLARHYLGLTVSICGAGFAVATDIIKKEGYDATCITEDLEYTCKLAMKNIKVHYTHEAIVYDEKPSTFNASSIQRKRWAQGQVVCMKEFFIPLLKKGLKEKSLLAFDAALYLFQPIRIIVMFFALAIGIFPIFMTNIDILSLGFFIPSYLWFFIVGMQMIYPFLVIASENKFNMRFIVASIIYPFYNLTWIPIMIEGLIDSDKPVWSHTAHKKSVSIEELEDLKINNK